MKYKVDELDKMAMHLSQREKVAQKASRDSVKYKQCQYLIDKLGKIYLRKFLYECRTRV